MAQINKQVAGVLFTENGIMIERKYHHDQEFENKRPRIAEEKFSGEMLEIAKRLAKYRMAHCFKQLHSNLANAKVITEQSIVWTGGHFEVPVWEQLEAIVFKLADVRELNRIQCQQLIRSIMFNAPSYWLSDHDACWNTIKDSDNVKLTDEFKMFITEQCLVTDTQW